MIVGQVAGTVGTPFHRLASGVVFQYGFVFYIRCDTVGLTNAVRLDTGATSSWASETLVVVKPKATLLPEGTE